MSCFSAHPNSKRKELIEKTNLKQEKAVRSSLALVTQHDVCFTPNCTHMHLIHKFTQEQQHCSVDTQHKGLQPEALQISNSVQLEMIKTELQLKQP